MDERRVEELLHERARRRAEDPLGPGASERLLGQLSRARGSTGRRLGLVWLGGGLAAAAAILAAVLLFEPERTHDYGALPIELALLDSAGRALDGDPAARGSGDAFVRPDEVVLELVPGAANGFWWTYVYDPGGHLHAARTGQVAEPGAEVLWTHPLGNYAALAAGDSIVSIVVVSAREEIPTLDGQLPAEIGSGVERRRALDAAAERLAARFGCTVTVRELTLEQRP